MVKEAKSAGILLYYFDEHENEPYFLMLKYKTYWGFAKGLIEEGESERETAIRETKEEAGIEKFDLIEGFEHRQKWFFRMDGELIYRESIFFLAKTTKEEAEKTKISFEHEGFSWDTYKKALERIKIKSNKEMLERVYEFVMEHEKQKKLF